jgi:hypothetical protein
VLWLNKELLEKNIFNAADRTATNKNITKALLKLFKPENETTMNALLDHSISIADDYLTHGNEYSVFKEPKFLEKGSDLNTFLNWEQLGKGKDYTPLLDNLIAQYKIVLKIGIHGQPKYRDMIRDIILANDTIE